MKTKLAKFLEALDNYGEHYFSLGSVKEDYNHIIGVLKAQGFWSGTRYRFYFDNNMNLLNVESRW